MKRRSSAPVAVALVAVAVALLAPALLPASPAAPALRAAALPAFSFGPIDAATRERMTGVSWRPGCPVGLADLRLLKVRHWGFDGRVHRGRLVVHEDSARDMVRVLRRLFRHRFPIREMRLVDAYGADDRRSMAADNTSAFNCRYVSGTSRWSEHAYGRAIDLNPVENPYTDGAGYFSPPAGARFGDRSQRAKGLVHRGGNVVRAFAAIGWEWGGDWSWPKDYQHFSLTGS